MYRFLLLMECFLRGSIDTITMNSCNLSCMFIHFYTTSLAIGNETHDKGICVCIFYITVWLILPTRILQRMTSKVQCLVYFLQHNQNRFMCNISNFVRTCGRHSQGCDWYLDICRVIYIMCAKNRVNIVKQLFVVATECQMSGVLLCQTASRIGVA